MTPLLMLNTALIGLLGSFIDVHLNEHTRFTAFSLNAFKRLTFLDLATSPTKATFYGFTICMVSCYQGFYTVQVTKGVGRAANKAFVYAMYPFNVLGVRTGLYCNFFLPAFSRWLLFQQ
jgi:phospholipid/cholesterol/gamma-HCH transport system permease protein